MRASGLSRCDARSALPFFADGTNSRAKWFQARPLKFPVLFPYNPTGSETVPPHGDGVNSWPCAAQIFMVRTLGSWRSSRSTRRDQISGLPRTKRLMSWSEESPGFADTPQQAMPARREASHGNRDEPSQSGRVKRATGWGKQPQEVPCDLCRGGPWWRARRRLATGVQEEWQPSTEPGLQGIWS